MKNKHHKVSTFSLAGNRFYNWFDLFLIIASSGALIIDIIFSSFSQWDFVLIAIAIAGLWPVLLSALKAVIHRQPTIDLLASIALIFSLLAQEWRSAIFISLMLASARVFARYTENRAKRSIDGLLKLRPTKVHVLVDGQPTETGIEKVKIGDLILVDAGERIAVDGVVQSGQAEIDQSSLTGESMPVAKREGDDVLSSTLNLSGSLVVRATKVGQETTFARILALVEKSQEMKTPIASIADHFTRWYIIITLFGALTIYLWIHNLTLVLSILLVTCADDIAVAIPLALTAAIGKAAQSGIIIKGGPFLEGLTKTKIMIFDKTGTLTEGKMKVQTVKVFPGHSEDRFFSFIGSIENESNHPAAKTISRFVKDKKIEFLTVNEVHEEPGFGIKGIINNETVVAGKVVFLTQNNVKFSEEELKLLNEEKNRDRTVTVLSVNGQALGFISLSDNVRPDAHHVIGELKKKGVEKLVMLTGDNEVVAGEVARQIGISDFKANLMPQDKIDYLKKLVGVKDKVAMVGDGVNDAAALAMADIGIAMGAIGADAAIENADIVLMKDRLTNILDAFNLSRATMKIIYQNLLLWGVINAVGLALVFARVLGPSEAAAFNFFTDFVPLGNSLRIFKFNLHKKAV